MSLLRWMPVAGMLMSSAVVSGCAGSGPDLRGPEGPGLMAAYSGDWILLPTESDDLNAKVRDAMRGPGAGGVSMGGRPGSGERGCRAEAEWRATGPAAGWGVEWLEVGWILKR